MALFSSASVSVSTSKGFVTTGFGVDTIDFGVARGMIGLVGARGFTALTIPKGLLAVGKGFMGVD